MINSPRKRVYALVAIASLMLSPLAVSHLDDKQIAQSYRQSYFAMIAANFGPMAAMVKGEMPWDEKMMAASADQLAALANLDVMRGFREGTEKGTTRAKPEIWENKEDFQKKMEGLRQAADNLKVAASGTDREAIAAQVGETGQACKACHDDYKAKDYLY